LPHGNFKNFIAGGAGENFIRRESANLKSGENSSEQNFDGQASAGAVNLKSSSAQQGANGGEKQDAKNVAKQGESYILVELPGVKSAADEQRAKAQKE